MKQIGYTIMSLIIMMVLGIQGQEVMAQLQIAPTAIYLNEDNATGRIVVRNSSQDPVQVEIDLIFGYPATDETGTVYFRHYENIDDDQPSAVNWIRIYPRFFELSPGERQTVRFAARPPAGLETGEYWARPRVLAQVSSTQDFEQIDDQISTRLNFRKRTVLALSYRNGDVGTGIAIRNLAAQTTNEKIVISVDLDRLGNAAFIGHYEIRLFDSDNNEHITQKREIAVYNDQNRSFTLNSDDLAAGTYRIELELYSYDRKNNGVLQTSPSSGTATIAIP